MLKAIGSGCNGQDGASGTRPDGRCFDTANRYVNCGNGTITDTVTGLIWLQRADCVANSDWAAANRAAAALKDGDWLGWVVNLAGGIVTAHSKFISGTQVWPVRKGSR